MRIVEVLAPIVLMIGIGVLLRKKKILTRENIAGLKAVAAKVILPAAIFSALASASFSASTFLTAVIMFAVLLIGFGAGFMLRGTLKEPYGRYVPFLLTVYEGGMMGYPLYSHLMGADKLSNIAVLDIAGVLFGFSIYIGMLTQMERGEKPSAKIIARDALRSPTFIAAVAGIIAGLFGFGSWISGTAAGPVYRGIIEILTAPLSSVILIVIGYEISFEKKLLPSCLKMAGMRVAVQAVLAVLVVIALKNLFGAGREIVAAAIIYMSCPPSFSIQSFIKNEKASGFVATTNSLYCLVSILVYAVTAAII